MQNVTWYQGWMIVLRCAQFNCREGGPKFASTALLKRLPSAHPVPGISWLRPTLRSIVFPEEAFDTVAEANDDALTQARNHIATIYAAGNVSAAPV